MINLAIALEYLFSPASHHELAHQIAVNVSRFVEDTDPNLMKNYKLIKKIYSVRSSLVHGGMVSDDKLIEIIGPAFQFVSTVLRKLLLSSKMVKTFDQEKDRRELLTGYIFGK